MIKYLYYKREKCNYNNKVFFFFNSPLKVKMLVTQSCPTLCDPMGCSPPGSSVHGILQARILEWVAIPFSRGSSSPRDQTQVSCVSCIEGRFFTTELLGKPSSPYFINMLKTSL